MKKTDLKARAEMSSKKNEEETSENEIFDEEDTAKGIKNILIWIVTIVATVGAAWIFDLNKAFFIIVAYATWFILHKFFD